MKDDFKKDVVAKNNNTTKNAHAGHRGRMQERIAKYGLRSLEPHELMEYLLWFTIPRKDTNPIGHELIDKFGSIANILNADPKYLQKINGIGERTALFLTSLPEIFSIYKESFASGKLDVLNSVSDCVRYFRSKFEIRKNEEFFIFCLNGLNRVIKYTKIAGLDDTTIKVDPTNFNNFINDKNVVNVIVCHTHPFGQATPSYEDLKTTETLISICNCLQKNFVDHIVLNDTDHFSFGRNGLIDKIQTRIILKMNPDLKKQFDDQNNNNLKSRKFSPFSYLDSDQEKSIIFNVKY